MVFIRVSRLFLVTCALCSACTLSLPDRDSNITILSYNVQNLFDDHANGGEYEEYDPGRSDWSTAEYYHRLEGLSRVIRDATDGGPDIVALQEIEHQGVLDDLVTRYLGGLGYEYIRTAESSPISLGVLSRIPVIDAHVHGVRIDDEYAIRPMLEVEFTARDSNLIVIVCHWKSKAGGARETEPYRIASAEALEAILVERIPERPRIDIVVVGDLNENHDEWERVSRAYPTALVGGGDQHARGLKIVGLGTEPYPDVLVTPWIASESEGSYVFQDRWETIDHVLLNPNCFDGTGVEFESFRVLAPAYILTADSTPLKYIRRTGTGFSDHLPILATLAIRS